MYEVNRSVFMLIPQEPFWMWLNDLPDIDLGDVILEDLQLDANAYLTSPCEVLDDVWNEIDGRLEELFSAELADWCEDRDAWPDLVPEIFYEWFDIRLSTIVTDLSRDELAREAFEVIHLD